MAWPGLASLWQGLDARIETGPGRDRARAQARIVLLTSTLMLALHYWVGMRPEVAMWLGLAGLRYWIWWCASQCVFFLLLPALVSRYVLGLNPLDFGCRWRDARGHGRIYAGILGLALAGVWLVSGSGTFVGYYPMFKGAGSSWTELVVWECLYALQFVAVEFFFRGFMLRATETALGSLSVFVMVLPYCLFHDMKPWPEFYASIGAGLVLGGLALSTRSIWGGVILHVTVAWSMDLLALLHADHLPRVFWPGS